VKCETCHGPSRDHAEVKGKLPIPTDARRLCTLCHEKMPSRPATQPQIVVAEHAGDQQCTVCHNPHRPAIGRVATATGGDSLTAGCARCHGARGEGKGAFPALAGKSVEYLSDALGKYRAGELTNPMMNTLAKSLTDEQITSIAEHYASLGGGNGAPALAASCASCHGDKGQGGDGVPGLAGRDAAALAAEIEAYRSGARTDPVMRTIAGRLSDEVIRELADYYAGIGSEPAGDTSSEGELIESCAGCHGDNGEGDGGDIPAIAGLDVAHLVAQLEAYRSGERKNDMMGAVAEALQDQDIAALAAHFAGLPAVGAQ